MYQRSESSFRGHSNATRYRLTSSLNFEPIQPDGEERDPLYEFFSSGQSIRDNMGMFIHVVSTFILFNLPFFY